MAGGSLPRGGKSAYFRRLSELAPANIRTRITEFIESVAYKDELNTAIEDAQSTPSVPAAHEHSGYALKDHTHGYALKNHTHPAQGGSLSDLDGVAIGFPALGDLLMVGDLGAWVNRPPRFDSSLFALSNPESSVSFDLSDLGSSVLRTISVVDADMTILSTVNHDDLTDGGMTYLHTHDHDYLYGAGYYTHYEIDWHIDDATIHFTEASIHHPEPVTVAVSPGPAVILGDDVVVTGLAPTVATHVDAVAELVFLSTGEIVMS